MSSALYRGHLVHTRRDRHARRRFRYPLYVACLDLDRLGDLPRLIARNRPGLFALRDDDYQDGAGGLRAAFDRALAARGLPRPAHARLVTQLRVAGYVFNPVSFFLGYDPAGALTAAIAEINNTYGGRHRYLLGPADRVGGDGASFRTDKAFFVSPFLHGPARYRWSFDAPLDGDRLGVTVDVRDPDDARVFLAHLGGVRAPLTGRALLAAALRYPLMPLQVIGLIHWQALHLHRAGVPYRRPGPDHRPCPPTSPTR
jgi:DUF1365 family protein